MSKRILCLVLVFLFVLSLTACSGGRKQENDEGQVSISNIPAYGESDLGAAIGIKQAGNKMELDSKGNLVIYEYDRSGYSFIDSAGKRAGELKCNVEGFDGLFTIDPSGNLCILVQKYEGKGKDGDIRETNLQLVVYNPKGEKLRTIPLGKRTFTEKQSGISDIAIDARGNLYLLEQPTVIEVINAQGAKVKEIPAAKISSMELDSEGNLLLGSYNGGNGRAALEKLSPEGESIWKQELDVGIIPNQLEYSSKDKTICILTEKGVMSYTSEGKARGFIMDFKQTSLLRSNLYLNDLVVNDGSIIILGFQSDNSSGSYIATPVLYSYYRAGEDQKPGNQKTLTLALAYSERFMEAAVSQFQAKHPDIRIKINDYKAAYTSTDSGGPSDDEIKRAEKAIEDFQRINTTEIMAGKGADIIEIESLPYRKYLEKNTLVNLSKIMAQDKSFNIKKYNKRILEACKYKGNLYFMPVSYNFFLMVANKSILEKEDVRIDGSKWIWEDFFDIAVKVTKDTNGDGTIDQYALPKMEGSELMGYMLNTGDYIDYERKTANFDSQEFVSMLELVKNMQDKKVLSPELTINKLWQMKDSGTIAFNLAYYGGYNTIIYNQALANSEVEVFGIPSSKNSYDRAFMLGRTFAINNNSKYEKEAWEFIKFLVSDEIQKSSDLFEFVPNLAAQKEKAKAFLAQPFIYTMYANQGRKIKKPSQVDVDFTDSLIDKLGVLQYNDPQVSKIVTEAVKDFFDGRRSAEETARMIQGKVTTYLGE